MKKPLLFMLLAFMATSSIFSQETSEINQNQHLNEVKLNMTNLIAFKWFDVGYEYILNEESSIGLGTLFKIGSNEDENEGLDEYRTFSITPYYRHFFSKKYAQGFFVEGFAMIHSGKDTYDYKYIDGNYKYQYDKYTDLAIGISTGAKFITKRGFIAEVYLGIGRDMLDQSDIEVVGRGGIAFGYRF